MNINKQPKLFESSSNPTTSLKIRILASNSLSISIFLFMISFSIGATELESLPKIKLSNLEGRVTELGFYKSVVSQEERPYLSDFQELESIKGELKVPYTNQSHGIYFRFSPSGEGDFKEKLCLSFNHALSGRMEVFRKEGQGDWERVGVTGSRVPYNDRLIKGFQLAVPIQLSVDKEVFYFLRRTSQHRFDTQIFFETIESFKTKQYTLQSYYFFYMGAFVALILYNLFLYFSSREKNYLYYFLFGVAIHLVVLSMTGFIDYLLAFTGMSWSQYLILFSSSSLIASVLFAIHYNNLVTYCFYCLKGLYVALFAALAVFLISLGPWAQYFGGAHLGAVIDIVIPVGIVMMIGSAIIAMRKGHILARFYLTSWAFMFGGAFVYFGHFAGLFRRNFFTSHAVMWGNLLEMLIVSLGLAYKISILDREKKEAIIMAKGKQDYERLVRVLLHDIGNPLNLIKYYTDLKNRKPEKFKEKESVAWEKISFGITKISEIISFHRKQEMNLSNSFRSLEMEKISLIDAYKQTFKMFEESLEKKKLKLEFDFVDDQYILAEKVSLVNEVLNNIISNAIKFSFEGDTISIKAGLKAGRVHVIISDQGQGMEENDLFLFKESKPLVSRLGTKGEKGTGYGLFLIKSYMDLYGGEVFVKSISKNKDSINHGTQVTLVFQRPS